MHRARGFTLIELAVVIFIIGILATAVTTVVSTLVVSSREKATRTNQDAIKTALSTFLVRNSRLPCPASITIATGAAGNGVEAVTPGTCTGVITSGAAPNIVKTGAIPWVSLGLSEDTSLDGYGHRLTYQVMANATKLTPATVSGMLGSITIHSAGLGVAGNQTNNCTTTTYNPCGAVVVIVSHGTNGYGGYTTNGAQIPIPASVTGNDERENSNGDNKFVVKSYSNIDANPYDDIVLSMTVGDLITPLAAQGSIKDYQATLNAKMAFLKGAIIARAYANGGIVVGQRVYVFPASLTAAGLVASQNNDPWGTPIVYSLNPFLPVPVTINCTTPPLTLPLPVLPVTVFTLTSLGQDAIPSVADDVTITVTVADIAAIIANAGCSI